MSLSIFCGPGEPEFELFHKGFDVNPYKSNLLVEKKFRFKVITEHAVSEA
jgi:hypothetical protein